MRRRLHQLSGLRKLHLLPLTLLGALPSLAHAQAGASVETDTDRPGSDIRRTADVATAEACRQSCDAEPRCLAYTWTKPGVDGPTSVCYLKNPAPPMKASTCCVSGVKLTTSMEPDTDRVGSDFRRTVGVATAEACRESCDAEPRCLAYAWTKPGVDGPTSVCYLKNPAPPVKASSCCVSGAKLRASMELDTDRVGSDIRRTVGVATAEACRQSCDAEPRCLAYAWTKPGVDGPTGVCYLKNPAPPVKASSCCVSGSK